jgi:tRNA (guanine37-N1)-methyltransferase
MRVAVVTIFPELVRAFTAAGLIRRAVEEGRMEVVEKDLRDFTTDRHRVVDDVPFGGGGGMVMKPEPLFAAVEAIRREGDRVILMSPQGTVLKDAVARRLALVPGLVVICGRYEGVDERVREGLVDEEVSIGDYVLSGGELPALVLIEAVSRFLPGVVGNAGSVEQDSFATGFLDYPHYTRPAEFKGAKVPGVLVSGNHGEVEKWRRREALRQTLLKRPDLLERATLSPADRAIIESLGKPRKAGEGNQEE